MDVSETVIAVPVSPGFNVGQAVPGVHVLSCDSPAA